MAETRPRSSIPMHLRSSVHREVVSLLRHEGIAASPLDEYSGHHGVDFLPLRHGHYDSVVNR